MITLTIAGRHATLADDQQIQLVIDNPDFADHEAFSLEITLPLKDSPANSRILGHLTRLDDPHRRLAEEAQLTLGDRTLTGAATLMETTATEAKIQFLEGATPTTEQTRSFDDIYIDTLDLGTVPEADRHPTLTQAADPEADYVALPWYDATSKHMHNIRYARDAQGNAIPLQWNDPDAPRSFQPFLHYILRRIFTAIGYRADITALLESPYRHLLICNTVPPDYEQHFAWAMPHWTVTQLITELEKLLPFRFEISHTYKTARVQPATLADSYRGTFGIPAPLDDYRAEILQPSDTPPTYIRDRAIRYKSLPTDTAHLESCPDAIAAWPPENIIQARFEEQIISELEQSTSQGGRDYDTQKYRTLFHCQDNDTYYTYRRLRQEIRTDPPIASKIWLDIVPVNEFAPLIPGIIKAHRQPVTTTRRTGRYTTLPPDTTPKTISAEETDQPDSTIEIACQPAGINHRGDMRLGYHICLAPKQQEAKTSAERRHSIDTITDPIAEARLRSTKANTTQQFYDTLHLALYTANTTDTQSGLPRPTVHTTYIHRDFKTICRHRGFTLRPRDIAARLAKLPDIDPTVKYTIRFLSDRIPDTRDTFIIAGRRFICQQLTITFDARRRSQLIEGTFWKTK